MNTILLRIVYAYTYDATGRVESFTSPEGQTYRYEWTPEGRLREIEIPGEGVYRFHEYQGDAPTRMTLPGVYMFSNYPTLGVSGHSDYAASSAAVSSFLGMIAGSRFRPSASRRA